MILNTRAPSTPASLLFIPSLSLGSKGKRLFICLLINWLLKLFVVRMFKYSDYCITTGNARLANLPVGTRGQRQGCKMKTRLLIKYLRVVEIFQVTAAEDLTDFIYQSNSCEYKIKFANSVCVVFLLTIFPSICTE